MSQPLSTDRDDIDYLNEEMQEPMSMKYSYMPYMDESERLHFDNYAGGHTEKAYIYSDSLAIEDIEDIESCDVERRFEMMSTNKDERIRIQKLLARELRRKQTEARKMVIGWLRISVEELAQEYERF